LNPEESRPFRAREPQWIQAQSNKREETVKR